MSNEFNLEQLIDEIAKYEVKAYKYNYDDIRSKIVKEIQLKNRVTLAFNINFQETLGDYEVKAYYDLADLTLKQEFNNHDKKYILIIKQFTSIQDILIDAKNLDYQRLTKVSDKAAMLEISRIEALEDKLFSDD
ncbi:hypothetical protein HCJ58_14420 [Listeria sp. FSL L7-1509]|uniref:Uncharacterized protein n=1 Tax=Listeria immobilis TaxID=2713502 RepID=A0ABR6SZT6_9LIST|nr:MULTISPECIES: hypothetical protein [Listeria]MBC1483979.1 hypothetical protein [Listeria immobilis]MBC1508149.1 hypothetical protein [Listeria immobilis]MBC1511188.1 hypothetical protein [Listeria immobilis]MBC1839599.1 hypothetical protein [Listeria seeligeri]MBC6313708.1 hypothetical protein [Listeria immobilis]